jgi:hypothetical protein
VSLAHISAEDAAKFTASEILTSAGMVSQRYLSGRPGILQALMTAGRHERAGHDRERWKSVQWEDYRAPVRSGHSGIWDIAERGSSTCWPGRWIAEVENIPWHHGRYTLLTRWGDVIEMNDSPADTIGRLPFLDRAARQHSGGRWLITGLGLGVVPSWLLRRVLPVRGGRVDVVEIDADVIALHRHQPWAVRHASINPVAHIYHADALGWTQPPRGCELHSGCLPSPSWDGVFHDIWHNPISPWNLPEMRAIEERYADRAGWQMCRERPECEARAQRITDGGEMAAAVTELPDGALTWLIGLKLYSGAHTRIYQAELAHRRERT